MTNLKLELTNMYGKGRFFCQTCTHNEDSTEGVDQASLNRYKRDGVICIRNYFDQYWLDLVKEGIEKNLNNPSRYRDWLIGEDGKGLYFNDLMNWKNIKEFTEFVWKSPAARLAGTLMESKVWLSYRLHVVIWPSFKVVRTQDTLT